MFTVIIGNNGLGKSNIIKGLQVALCGVLRFIPTLPGTLPFRRIIEKDDVLVKWSASSGGFVKNMGDTSLTLGFAEIVGNETKASSFGLVFRQETVYEEISPNDKPDKTDLDESIHLIPDQFILKDYGKSIYDNFVTKAELIPVFANFETSRLTEIEKRKQAKKEKMNQRLLKMTIYLINIFYL